MRDQKLREHMKAYETQQKQITALKKSGKSAKQAAEEMKNRLQNKQNKAGKAKKGSSAIGDEGSCCLEFRIKKFSWKRFRWHICMCACLVVSACELQKLLWSNSMFIIFPSLTHAYWRLNSLW